MISDCLINDFTNARKKYYKMYNFIKALFIETNPIPIKYALYKKGLIVSDNVRLPLMKMTNGEHIKTVMYMMSIIDMDDTNTNTNKTISKNNDLFNNM